MKRKAAPLFALLACAMICFAALPLKSFGGTSVTSFNDGWRFIRSSSIEARAWAYDDSAWEVVSLPHTARLEALVTGKKNPQWQGICWYRKSFLLPSSAAGKQVLLRFEGAMNTAEISVNGQPAGQFMGGYLPYVMDISDLVNPGMTNFIAVRLDNTDNPLTGPKPLADLDFNLYSGLYRDAELIIKDKLHITDSILADKVAGGGLFVTFPSLSQTRATVNIQTHVQNSSDSVRHFRVRTTLLDAKGRKVASTDSLPKDFPAGSEGEISQPIEVKNPKLWSPQSPTLYSVRSEIIEGGKIVDSAQTRIGIRRIEITKDGLRVNGEKMFLRGANRHQEYPYIGNALSDAAQYRDALKIKEAGFDYVRCSHYPPSPAFLDACDELGIVVMDSLMGWQYFNPDPAFTGLKLRECREMIRRDRNHPCVIMWEVSLNESDMPKSFIEKADAVAHEEFPGDQCFTSGWKKGYDVFMQARQHGGCVGVTNHPCVVSEYGDWEYFAQNAGFEQDKWKDLKPADRNSRQLRGEGEVRLLQQAMNFQEAHNDNLKTAAFGDSIWVMFDYNRGYADEIESSGVMDIFRLPKFSYWFFRTQRDPEERIAGEPIGPVIFIADYWTADSPLAVRIFSNCDEIALYLNDRLIERRSPDRDRISTNLKHPPFTFHLVKFEPGTLRAVGYLNGHKVANASQRTPGSAASIALEIDRAGRADVNGKDILFCHALLKDRNDTLVPNVNVPITFGVLGGSQVLGDNSSKTEAGIATVLSETGEGHPAGSIYAMAWVDENHQARLLSTAISLDGSPAPKYISRYTTDGRIPTSSSPVFTGIASPGSPLKAALFVDDKIVVSADFNGKFFSAQN